MMEVPGSKESKRGQLLGEMLVKRLDDARGSAVAEFWAPPPAVQRGTVIQSVGRPGAIEIDELGGGKHGRRIEELGARI